MTASFLSLKYGPIPPILKKIIASLLSFSSVPSPNVHHHSPEWCGYRSLNGTSIMPRLVQLFSNFPQGCIFLFWPPSSLFSFFLEHNLTSCPHTRYTLSFHLLKPSLLNLLPIIILLTPPATFIMLIFFP